MRAKIIIAICLLLSYLDIQGQELTQIASVALKHKAVQVSIDRQGQVYIASDNGDVDRYDAKGELAYHFSPDTKGNVSLIEAWQGLRTFVFYRDFQQYLFLDRFLTSPNRLNLDNDFSRYYQLATIAGDNNLWLVDQQELSLKKLDIDLYEFLIETPFNLNLDPDDFELSYIREYQNLVFISDKTSGVLVFDNLGNYLETLPLTGLNYFSFSGNELLGLDAEGQLRLIDIYTKKEREISLPDLSYQFILMENRRLYGIGNRRLDIYSID